MLFRRTIKASYSFQHAAGTLKRSHSGEESPRLIAFVSHYGIEMMAYVISGEGLMLNRESGSSETSDGAVWLLNASACCFAMCHLIIFAVAP